MSGIYKRCKSYSIIKGGDRYGIAKAERVLLPCEYDAIFIHGDGFIITKNSKSGYISFYTEGESVKEGKADTALRVFLPCTYDRIEPTRNGLVLITMTPEEHSAEKRAWLDLSSGKLYENYWFMKNHGDYDELLDTSERGSMPFLKRAGEEFYAKVPFGLTVHILYEIPVRPSVARYFVCAEESMESDAEINTGYSYFLMIVLPESYTFTESCENEIALIENFPKIYKFWEEEAEKEREYSLYKNKNKIEKNGKTCRKVEVKICSREAIEIEKENNTLQNSAVISFFDPSDGGRRVPRGYAPVDYSSKCDRVLYVGLHDLDPDVLSEVGLTEDSYFPEADEVAEFIRKAYSEGLEIVCQCEYGQSRSAACAAAILQYFEGRGIDIFSDYRYYPNQIVFHKVLEALSR